MLLRSNSLALRALMFASSPTYLLPALFPLWIMPARVGNDYETFVKVSFRRPR